MNNVHQKMSNFRKWVDVDVANTTIKNKLFTLIDDDYQKDSPEILTELETRKYSPFKKYLSEMGKSQLYCLQMEKKITTSAYVLLAAVKFKNKLKKTKCKELCI